MKNRIIIFLTIIVALLNLAVFRSKSNLHGVDISSIINIITANAESPTYNDCQSIPGETLIVYDDGEIVGIARNYSCVGNTGPCCSGWIVSFYERNPGGTSSPEYSDDHRIHTRC
jgi:hypothetical protein